MILNHHRLFSNIYVTVSENFRHREKPRDPSILLILHMGVLRFGEKEVLTYSYSKENYFAKIS